MSFTRADYETAAEVVRQRLSITPDIGLILGSGLGPLAESVEDAAAISYAEIPGFPQSTVHGHSGRLVAGYLESKPVLVMQGRVHFYEGYTMQQVTFPVRVMQMLGIKTLIVTNAAGGVNPNFTPGDIMLINDHINLLGMMGQNPLMGPNDESLGTRFPGMGHAYDAKLRQLAHQVAAEGGIPLREGIYIVLSGPTFETPADIRMIRQWGADAVGMSTVPEVIAALHGGMRVLGFSTITNKSIDVIDSSAETNHEEVLETGKLVVPRLMALLRGILRRL